uniref:Uncharacterized protein n=1 Tax=Arundo donax TaxID=35708 RepID=A0A0A8YQL9_ARUDO
MSISGTAGFFPPPPVQLPPLDGATAPFTVPPTLACPRRRTQPPTAGLRCRHPLPAPTQSTRH